jgi:predicted Zn finger-like uncharacterized protein
MIVACECGAKLKIDDDRLSDKGVRVRCPRCGVVMIARSQPMITREAPAVQRNLTPPATTGPLVLIAHDSDVVRALIIGVLTEAGFRVEVAVNGFEALNKVVENKPKGMVLDVGLPGIYGFELCSRLKGHPDTAAIKIVLVSSVYDMRRYKRTPESLYGADDYIEKHHIQDLPEKFRKLLSPEQPLVQEEPISRKPAYHHNLPEMSRPPAREFQPSLLSHNVSQLPPEPIRHEYAPPASLQVAKDSPIIPESFSLEASIFQKEEYDIPQVDEADPDAVEKAKRFARIIVSDIALYNQEAVVKGIRNGTFFELLKNDIQEGRELYEKRVPPGIRRKKDYYQEAFDNFIAAAEKKTRGSRP